VENLARYVDKEEKTRVVVIISAFYRTDIPSSQHRMPVQAAKDTLPFSSGSILTFFYIYVIMNIYQ
jgi:hypothetical protein